MFRFTIRELVLLTVIVAMGLGWWVHARRLQSEMSRLQTDLLMQADYVSQFVSVLTKLGCEIPPDTDPRCARRAVHSHLRFRRADETHRMHLVHLFRSSGRAAANPGRRIWTALPQTVTSGRRAIRYHCPVGKLARLAFSAARIATYGSTISTHIYLLFVRQIAPSKRVNAGATSPSTAMLRIGDAKSRA